MLSDMNRYVQTLMDLTREDARRIARELDECGSETEFRLRCAARNEDPEKAFAPYIQYLYLAMGYYSLGLDLAKKPCLSDWWAFEKIQGAHKPNPWVTGLR